MQYHHAILVAAAVVLVTGVTASPANDASAPLPSVATSSATTPAVAPQNVEWAPAPQFPAGAEMAVLQGDPRKAEPFTVRLRFPNGYRIPPYTHATAEYITVLNGTFFAGAGTRFVETDMQEVRRDGFVSLPGGETHYAMVRGQTVVQIHAVGPLVLTWAESVDGHATR